MWTAWKCTDGMTHCIRIHLHKYHEKSWREAVIKNRLKNWLHLFKTDGTGSQESILISMTEVPLSFHENFTHEAFYSKILQCIIENDLVSISLFQLDIISFIH